jgi:hypothetical protein
MRSLYACVFGVLIACGGGGSSSPEGRCEALLEHVCDRAVECDLGFEDRDECMAEIADANDCSEAKEVGDSYEECVDDVDDASCQALFPGGQSLAMPASCKGAIAASP